MNPSKSYALWACHPVSSPSVYEVKTYTQRVKVCIEEGNPPIALEELPCPVAKRLCVANASPH